MKLDELIRATREADDVLIDIEAMAPDEIRTMHAKYHRLAERVRKLGLNQNGSGIESPRLEGEWGRDRTSTIVLDDQASAEEQRVSTPRC
jgi:hypothetical protein